MLIDIAVKSAILSYGLKQQVLFLVKCMRIALEMTVYAVCRSIYM